MKFIHLSDLHIGRRVKEFSMLDDQAYILEQILRIVDIESPDAVLIAGDVYDKTIPSAEAVQLLDGFLNALKDRRLHVFVVSGNHDSAERIAFGSQLMEQSGVHMVPVYNGRTAALTLTDRHGPVHVYMLPYLKPAVVQQFFPETGIHSYTDAYRAAIARMDVQTAERNVLVAHAFVTNARTSGSEDISVGGADHVDGSVFDGFDYVALGHLHRPQYVGSKRIRYCGTPLKYHLSEIAQQKSVTVVELEEKGTLGIREIPLVPKREMRALRESYKDLLTPQNYGGTKVTDYLHITLTDENDVLDAMSKLRSVYPNIMGLDYDNVRTRAAGQINMSDDMPRLSPMTLFSDFYQQQNGQPMSDEQQRFLSALIEAIQEESL